MGHQGSQIRSTMMSTPAADGLAGRAAPAGTTQEADAGARSVSRETAARYLWGVTRLCMAWVFLWPFMDKMFGLGHETASADSFINGGNPTQGFLSGSIGPFSGIYHSIAGDGWLNVLFMVGLLGIGVALLLGIVVRVACGAGALLLLLMWSASLPPANDIFMDDHIIYALLLIGLALVGAGNTLGFGRWWSKTGLVQRFSWLT